MIVYRLIETQVNILKDKQTISLLILEAIYRKKLKKERKKKIKKFALT